MLDTVVNNHDVRLLDESKVNLSFASGFAHWNQTLDQITNPLWNQIAVDKDFFFFFLASSYSKEFGFIKQQRNAQYYYSLNKQYSRLHLFAIHLKKNRILSNSKILRAPVNNTI